MRVFDFRALFDKERIPYIQRGANVKRGEINIRCPWCGNADPSQHLGINLISGFYSCWRHKQGHSGKSPLRLLMQLLRIDYRAARTLAGLDDGYVDPDGFDALAARIMGRTGAVEVPQIQPLEFDSHFRQIMRDDLMTRRWYDYLWRRYFGQIDYLSDKYQLMADRKGARVIIPYFLEGRLIAWTGRAIGHSNIRYLDLPRDDCIVPIKQALYLFDEAAQGGKVLCVVEGQIDALKIDAYGCEFGVHAVALSTNSITEEQVYMLEELAPKFDEVMVMMDSKTEYGFVDSMRLKSELSSLRSTVCIGETPFGRSDPGELRPDEVCRWAEQLTGEKNGQVQRKTGFEV